MYLTKPCVAYGYSSRIPTRGAPHPLHRGQRLGKSWDDKVIQGPMEKSVPLIPIHEIMAQSGHRTSQMIDHYTKINNIQETNAAKKI